ncbi:hypothetical protein DSM112329_03761 [Paraconexibacter sp. AEG42_29]|uniref:Secreted protein n=1 Tax=Paraconexibacter sp. AEG42_29 TaxID=2997339 RepID=A0AAU7AZ26_9ACTN
MSAPARLALFGVLLLAVFGGAAVAGGAIDPDGSRDGTAPHAAAHDGAAEREATTDTGHGGAHGATSGADDDGGAHTSSDDDGNGVLPGLATSQDGYTLRLGRTAVARPGRSRLSFRILAADGRAVTRFDLAHARRLHLIIARRDLSSFVHLHPAMAADGTWTATADLPRGGTYRLFADFTIAGTQRTLGADVQVPGRFAPQPLARPSTVSVSDHGLTVRRRTGADGVVAFDVLRRGALANAELQEYLGAKGHLVTLRAGDLAYLHTHPESDRLAFGVDLPAGATYRSWVQFRVDGVVHTAAFTEVVAP